MVAVFGAMSLADPAQADISGGGNAPTAMAVTTANFGEDDATQGEATEERASDNTANPPVTALYSFADDEFTDDKFAGAESTWVIEFQLTGAYEPEDRILIELPAGSDVTRTADEDPADTDFDSLVEVFGPRPTDAVAGDRGSSMVGTGTLILISLTRFQKPTIGEMAS